MDSNSAIGGWETQVEGTTGRQGCITEMFCENWAPENPTIQTEVNKYQNRCTNASIK